MAYLLAHGGLAMFPYLVSAGGMLIQVRSQVACATDMMLFGYDQGVFSMLSFPFTPMQSSGILTVYLSRWRGGYP